MVKNKQVFCVHRSNKPRTASENMEMKNNLLMFLIFLFIQQSVSEHLQVVSSFYLGNIVYRSCRVHFVQQKVSLHLSSTDIRVGG